MAENNILNRNLLALSSRDPILSARLSSCKSDNRINYIRSRSNHLIPSFKQNNKDLFLHSRFDPIKEGQTYLNSSENANFLVFLGLGAGYHILPFLPAKHVSNIIIIDKDIKLLRNIIENIDMRTLFMEPRVKLLIDASIDDIKKDFFTHYLPVLSGKLKTITLQSRVNLEKKYFTEIVNEIKGIINEIADDYSVQSQFGKKWFINTISNLPKAESSTITLKSAHKVIITGAGPSLENHINQIKKLKTDSFLIATDTSLPFLLSHDIIPDLVISIDCQQISYHHFLSGYPKNIPLVLDLASPSVLTRLTDNLLFFSSGHPFSQYISREIRSFPKIDISGGNVSHAALSLAEQLNPEEIYLFGIDFSYPQGKSYAKGTYLYPYFGSFENRTQPLESSLFSFLLRNKNIKKEKIGEKYRYTLKSMSSYKERMEKAIINIKSNIFHKTEIGLPLIINNNKTKNNSHIKTFLSQGACKNNYKSFLKQYKKDFKALPAPKDPIGTYMSELTQKEKTLWMTQIPAAVAIASSNRLSGNDSKLPSHFLKMTKDWCISILNKYT